MAGDQRRSAVVYCVEVASVAIYGKEEARQAEQWEVSYIFPATELLSFMILFYHWKLKNCQKESILNPTLKGIDLEQVESKQSRW